MEKKEMINKFNIIFGIIFLLFLVGSINAEFDWKTFGNADTTLRQQQYGSFGIFNSSVSFVNVSNGYGTYSYGTGVGRTQPLVINGYVFIPNATSLSAYNSNLTLVGSINTNGLLVNQYGILDYNQDGIVDEIMGVWNVSTNYSLRVYLFNFTTLSFSKTYEFNLTGYITDYDIFGASDLFGLRCDIHNCYSVNQYAFATTSIENFTIYNSSGMFEHRIGWSNGTILNFSGSSNIKPRYLMPVSWTDVNNDGINEYLLVTTKMAVIFNSSGKILLYYPLVTDSYINDAKLYKGDDSVYWKLLVLSSYSSGTSGSITLKSININNGTTFWSNTYGLSPIEGRIAPAMAISTNYAHNLWYDIFVGVEWFHSADSTYRRYYVLSGNDGHTIDTHSFTTGGGNIVGYPASASLTIADMNNDGYDDFVMFSPTYSTSQNISIYDIHNNNNIYSTNMIESACVPADINLDSFLEVICSRSGETRIFSNFGLSNQNAVINSVSYNPSLVLSIGESVMADVSATDPQNFTIYYIHKCKNSDNYSVEDTNHFQGSCSYDVIGVYNFTVGVRNSFHSEYNYFSQSITVTAEGFVCNNNGICESSNGETYSNCPNDCSFTNQSQVQQSSGTGGSALPTQIVDVNNVNQGLLPEVYYGTIGFLSNTIQPMIILIFMIFFVLIILAIAFIIKKVGSKVGDLSR